MAIEINGHKVADLGLPGKSAYKTTQEAHDVPIEGHAV